MVTLLTSTDAAVYVDKHLKIFEGPTSAAQFASTLEVSDVRKRSLRLTDTGNRDDKEDDSRSEDEEERKGGTSIVQSIHKIKNYRDAWMLRQIAKGNSAEHTLAKLGVPYQLVNGEKVYSIRNPTYSRYLDWVKYNRDQRYSA
ncbi:hypothetical protein PHYBOEH_009337 [Phytophthora boehmeriae]|uniref:RxLR effector protein n=1 Tax=Phytophthora boehmeriae TaxID=109152 RepID=A0A8T1VTZ6_9STRA|nr:hypothetical protein PHYBOEH_009337 [Phytophthora boehmeriae]